MGVLFLFEIYSGGDDLVMPVIELELVLDDVVKYQLNFSECYRKDDFHAPLNMIHRLDDIQSDGEIIQHSFFAAVRFILQNQTLI